MSVNMCFPACGIIQDLINRLDLQPHPEGGYYRELHRAQQTVSYKETQRSAVTSIYYLLADQAYSAWHRIDADEIWAFHAGSLLALHVWAPASGFSTTLLGDPRVYPGAQFQTVVPAGCWFAAELATRAGLTPASPSVSDYVLLGCMVAPGFEFSAFQLADQADIADAIRHQGNWVRRLLA